MEYTTILPSVMDNVGIITLNNENNKNSIGLKILNELASQIEEWNNNDDVKAIIIRGKTSFASGIELKDLVSNAANYENMQKSFTKIANSEKAIIASISGLAIGIGLELALACDFVLASDDAKFSFPETSLNFIPSFGGIQRLVRTIGRAKAMEMVLTGRVMTAEEAEKSGIVSRIVPVDDLLEDSLKTAKRIALCSTKTVRIARHTVNCALAGLGMGIEIEKANGELCVLDADFRQSLLNLQKPKK